MAPRHILIVDDEPKVGYFLGRALELTNKECKVSRAHSGEEALDILDRSKVDLLITDLRMPGISGLELIHWVKASSPKTRIILITAYGSDKVQAEAQRLKIYHYITKPFNVREFTEVVGDALEQMTVTKPGFISSFQTQAFEKIATRLKALREDIGRSQHLSGRCPGPTSRRSWGDQTDQQYHVARLVGRGPGNQRRVGPSV